MGCEGSRPDSLVTRKSSERFRKRSVNTVERPSAVAALAGLPRRPPDLIGNAQTHRLRPAALVPGERIELPTNGLQNRCSTAELTRPQGSLVFATHSQPLQVPCLASQRRPKKSPGRDAAGALSIAPLRFVQRDARRCRQFALYQATSLRLSACCSVVSDTPRYCRCNSSSCVQRGSAMEAVDVIERNNPAHKAPRQ
jgi:hypothetical protein